MIIKKSIKSLIYFLILKSRIEYYAFWEAIIKKQISKIKWRPNEIKMNGSKNRKKHISERNKIKYFDEISRK